MTGTQIVQLINIFSIYYLVVACDVKNTIKGSYNQGGAPISSPAESSPDPQKIFDFLDIPNATLAAVIESNIIEISGITSNETISIKGRGGRDPWELSQVSHSYFESLPLYSRGPDTSGFTFDPTGTKLFFAGGLANPVSQYTVSDKINPSFYISNFPLSLVAILTGG